MPDKIVTVTGGWRTTHEKINEINTFLAKNLDYEVKSMTPFKTDGDEGVIIVLTERRIKRIKGDNK